MIKSKLMKVFFGAMFVLLVGFVSLAQADSAAERPDRPLPNNLAGLQLDSPVAVENTTANLKLDRELIGAAGTQHVIVRLSEKSVAEVAASEDMSFTAQLNQRGRIYSQQSAVLKQVASLDANSRVLGNARNALNAVMVDVDASALAELALNPAVVSINKIVDYEMDLSETVPYIGGTAVHDQGYDGTGVRVAVLDSGVDYYHAALGGSGDPADYAADDPNIIEPGTFPTAKIVGGYDFTGSVWPNGPVAFDPDPLDDGPESGHGTHVAHIIGGVGGVAPGADIYAVKVCSSVSTACSGVALIAGMDFAVDPNGDGNVNDAVDVINMSLGSDYGTAFDDDLSQAVDAASAIGVLTVSSAGNGSDKPFIVGTPSSVSTALAVAQTNVPSAVLPLMEITAPASVAGLYEAVFQPWSAPLTSVIEGPVLYGDGVGGNLDGCAPFAAGSLSGYIVFVDRGACNFTLKISNISQAGGLAGIIGLIAPGEPFSGGDGGDRPIDIPGFMISQADANQIKAGLPDTVIRFDPADGIPLVMHMVGSSSRGPAMGSNLLKPEIGAPGASVSAIAGSGTGTGPFGGTSGASPMVAGSAALLIDAYPARSWAEIKSVLINTGETDIINKGGLGVSELAPVTRIGGGEVRVDRALESPIAAWDADELSAALSFRFHDVSERVLVLRKTVTVRNYTNQTLSYGVASEFRYANDDTGAVSIWTPSQIRVPANGSVNFPVIMRIRGSLIHDWTMDSGGSGADPSTLTFNEYDGYIWLDNLGTTDDDVNPAHLPWQVLPRSASDVVLGLNQNKIELTNLGAGTANVEAYSLIGVSGDLPEGGPGDQNPTPDIRYLGYATFPVPAGFCSANDSFVMAFAFNTWEPVTHLNGLPWYEVDIDADQDGTFDYAVYNFDLSQSSGLSDGRVVTWVDDLAAGTSSAFFFADHDTNSGNTVLYICGEQIGMDATNFFDPMDIEAIAYDWYYSGTVTDALTGITISPLGEQYLASFDNGGIGATTIPTLDSDKMQILDFGFITNNTETGILLMYRQGAGGAEAVAVQVAP
ncbi:MAG: S8 family serine peptidase [Anaerolineales bacterium]|nr:S8 family serine peptidase [Anaerolineales bacterium]MCA9931269.1 S8 family serine peptidase [Anaerolineales bacterium]